jgi:DNA-binding PadR family transcriptional regulator
MSTQAELTTTSYAILGLLAVQPWTSYELAKQMDRGMSRFWPRAASKLYEEPKKLVAHGLARASTQPRGRRTRTVYTISAKGRRHLAAWHATPPAGPVLETESLVRVFFAEHGTKRDLEATLAATREWALAHAAINISVARSYLNEQAPFPDRLAHTLLVGRFLADFEDLIISWTDWAMTVVKDWPDDIRAAVADPGTLQYLAARRPSALATEG